MRTLLVLLTIAFQGILAHATADFDFVVIPGEKTVYFKEFEINETILLSRAKAVRFYFSEESFAAITPDTFYIEGEIETSEGGSHESVNTPKFGNLKSGARYYFKVGLVNVQGKLLYFTPDSETDLSRHSAIIE